jgi:hypothetical protein
MVIGLLGVAVVLAVAVVVERGVDEELELGRGTDDVGKEGDDTQELGNNFTNNITMVPKS